MSPLTPEQIEVLTAFFSNVSGALQDNKIPVKMAIGSNDGRNVLIIDWNKGKKKKFHSIQI